MEKFHQVESQEDITIAQEKHEIQPVISKEQFIKIAERVVEEIDYGVLESCFAEIQRRSLVATNTLQIKREHVRLIEDGLESKLSWGGHVLAYFDGTNINIEIDGGYESLKSRLDENETFAHAEDKVYSQIFNSIVHEFTHLAGYNMEGYDESGEHVSVNGVSTISLDEKSSRFGEVINEGITELIARNIAVEYAVRTGKLDVHESKHDSYQEECELVEVIVDTLSLGVGVSKELVWNSLVQAYMSGLDITSPEFLENMGETLNSDLFSSVAFARITNLWDAVYNRRSTNIPDLVQKFKELKETLEHEDHAKKETE